MFVVVCFCGFCFAVSGLLFRILGVCVVYLVDLFVLFWVDLVTSVILLVLLVLALGL